MVAAINRNVGNGSRVTVGVFDCDAALRSPLAPNLNGAGGVDGVQIVGNEVGCAVARYLVFEFLAGNHLEVVDGNYILNVLALNLAFVFRTVDSPCEYVGIVGEIVVGDVIVGSDGGVHILTLNHRAGRGSGPLALHILVHEVLGLQLNLAVANNLAILGGNLGFARIYIDDGCGSIIVVALLNTCTFHIDGEFDGVGNARIETSDGSILLVDGSAKLDTGVGR